MLSLLLHYKDRSDIKLYDLDFLQESLMRFMRLRAERDLFHPYVSSNIDQAIEQSRVKERGDVAIFDLGGGIQKGYINILEKADKILVPVVYSQQNISSSLEYLKSLEEVKLRDKATVLFNGVRSDEHLEYLQATFPTHVKSFIRRRDGYESPYMLEGITDIDRYFGCEGVPNRTPSLYRVANEYENLAKELSLL